MRRYLALVVLLMGILVPTAAADISPKQKYANALAFAIEKQGNAQQHQYKLSHFTCKPFGNAKMAGSQVFLCHAWIERLSTHHVKKGYLFFLADGSPISFDEAKTAYEASKTAA